MSKLASIKKQKNIDHQDESENQQKNVKKVAKNKNDEDYHHQFKKLYEHKDWTVLNTHDSVAPSDYTVTHVNQTHDFMVREFDKCVVKFI